MAEADEKRGQRNKVCDVVKCNKMGRVLAHMGGIEISYCPYHRKKYGERIINALVNSLFNYKLTNFLSAVKGKIFMDDDFLCEECGNKLKTYITEKTVELEDILEYQEENDAQFDEKSKDE